MKTNASELSIFGAPPTFTEPLHVGRPNVGDREKVLARIGEMLDRKWFTNNGPLVQEFEARIARLLNVKHCVAMCNGTIALEIGIRALGLSGEVIVPSFTFVATAHALQWQQINPIFGDINPDNYCLDPAQVEKLITARTTGIIGVHTFGNTCDVEALTRIARQRNLKLLFDAAHALGCTHKGVHAGGFGDLEVFSFHATKFFNTFEGGALTTNNDKIAEKVRLMRNFGFSGYDNVIYIGTNGKMTEVCAAMGLAGLDCIDQFIHTNRTHHDNYRKGLAGLAGLKVMAFDRNERANFQYVVVDVDPAVAPLERDQLVTTLHAENVLARRYFYPGCHEMEPYRSFFPHAHLLLPQTCQMVKRIMILPTGTGVTGTDVERVCHLIRLAWMHGPAVRAQLEKKAPAK